MSASDMAAAGDRGARAPAKRAAAIKYISWTALAFMTVSSVASLRPAATMAQYGLAAAFLYVLPAIVFLIPTALVAAELASGWSGVFTLSGEALNDAGPAAILSCVLAGLVMLLSALCFVAVSSRAAPGDSGYGRSARS